MNSFRARTKGSRSKIGGTAIQLIFPFGLSILKDMRHFLFNTTWNLFMFIPVLVGTGFLGGYLILFLKVTGRIDQPGLKKIGWYGSRILMVFMLVMLCFVVSTQIILHNDFKGVLEKKYSEATFSIGVQTYRITDPVRIQAFLDILRNEPSVLAHHSHPTDEIQFSFPESSALFSIGPDSQNADEFWLKIKDPEVYGPFEFPGKQFHSKQMTQWLKDLQ